MRTDCWLVVNEGPRRANAHKELELQNSLRLELANRTYKLLKTWSADNFRQWPERSLSIPV
jgi:hypothetical protein